MTPRKIKNLITKRYPGLVKSGMLTIKAKKDMLTISGSLITVQSIDKNIMRGYYPNICKPELVMEGNMDRSAYYTYKF